MISIKEKKKNKLTINIIIMTIVLIIIGILFPLLFKNLKFGLDLKGGFEVLYKVESLDGTKITKDIVKNTYKTISKRIDSLGVAEPVITIEGQDKIRIQLSGVKDEAEARKMLSSTANLTFRDTEDNLLMTASVLKSGGATVGQDGAGKPAVMLSVKDKDKFYSATKKISEQQNNTIVIWLDYDEKTDSFANEKTSCGMSESNCLSAATVSTGFASDVIIQGNFKEEEANNLVQLINSGSLSTKLYEVSSKTVPASLGEKSLTKTFKAGILGVALIMLLMIIIYRFAGFISSLGLLIYSFLTLGIFWLIGGVLTLPGIAAMVIGVGMAVDSSVISYSRIKDELSKNKSLKTAYKDGNKNSLVSIIDSNLTTLLVAIILFIFGESSIRGFATMLIISIVVTMLVMVYIMRILLNIFINNEVFEEKISIFIGNVKLKQYKNINFVKLRKPVYIFTIIIVIIGIISLSTNKLNLGVDFKGGTSINLTSSQNISESKIKKDIKKLNYDLYNIDQINNKNIDLNIEQSLNNNAEKKLKDYFYKKYQAKTQTGVISNVVKQELIKNTFYSLFLAFIGIIIYVSIRFRFSYAISGLTALIHDVFIIVTIFSIFKLEVSTMFIAAVLSIIGYSINDTIVAFDRIRELSKQKKIKTKSALEDVVNNSLRNILNRSLVTSITTILPVITLILIGSKEILNFNIALFIGLIAGTYSSIFIASQIFYDIEKNKIKEEK